MDLRHVVLCGMLTATACASFSQRKRGSADALPIEQLALEVDNRNWSDVAIWIEHDGTRTRFLTVTAAKFVTEAVPAKLVSTDGTLKLIAHRIGGGTNDYFVSPTVSVRTGYTVSFTIEPNLQSSSIGVW